MSKADIGAEMKKLSALWSGLASKSVNTLEQTQLRCQFAFVSARYVEAAHKAGIGTPEGLKLAEEARACALQSNRHALIAKDHGDREAGLDPKTAGGGLVNLDDINTALAAGEANEATPAAARAAIASLFGPNVVAPFASDAPTAHEAAIDAAPLPDAEPLPEPPAPEPPPPRPRRALPEPWDSLAAARKRGTDAWSKLLKEGSPEVSEVGDAPLTWKGRLQ